MTFVTYSQEWLLSLIRMNIYLEKCATISKILYNNEQESRLAMSKNSAQQWTRIIWYCWHQLLSIVAYSFQVIKHLCILVNQHSCAFVIKIFLRMNDFCHKYAWIFFWKRMRKNAQEFCPTMNKNYLIQLSEVLFSPQIAQIKQIIPLIYPRTWEFWLDITQIAGSSMRRCWMQSYSASFERSVAFRPKSV